MMREKEVAKVNKLKYTTHMGGVAEFDDIEPMLAIEALFVTLNEDQQNAFMEKHGTAIKSKAIDDAIDVVNSSRCYGIDKEQAVMSLQKLRETYEHGEVLDIPEFLRRDA